MFPSVEIKKIEVRETITLENHGQKIFGVFHRPILNHKCPALLICHGLGGNKTGKYRLYVTLATLLAKAGIATLRIDFRGSGDSEGEFEEMTLEGEVSDALKGIDFLCNNSYVDSNRLGIFGRSMGGSVAMLAARRFGNLKSIAMWAPVFSGEQWIEKWKYLHTDGLSESHKKEMMRIDGQVAGYEFYKQLFSIEMSKELPDLSHIPLLHIHGELDEVVTIEHAFQFMRYREHSEAETKFIQLPNSDHDFSHPEEQQIALQETCKWFIKTL